MPKRTETLQDRKSLTNIAERLEACAAAVRSVSSAMELQGLETVTVSNYPSLQLGVKNVESFANAAKSAIYEELDRRGAFRAALDEAREAEASTKTKRKRAS